MATIKKQLTLTFKQPSIAESYGPYISIHEAHLALASDQLNVVGMTVGVQTGDTIEEYWYQGGTTEQCLIKKQAVLKDSYTDLFSTNLVGDTFSELNGWTLENCSITSGALNINGKGWAKKTISLLNKHRYLVICYAKIDNITEVVQENRTCQFSRAGIGFRIGNYDVIDGYYKILTDFVGNWRPTGVVPIIYVFDAVVPGMKTNDTIEDVEFRFGLIHNGRAKQFIIEHGSSVNVNEICTGKIYHVGVYDITDSEESGIPRYSRIFEKYKDFVEALTQIKCSVNNLVFPDSMAYSAFLEEMNQKAYNFNMIHSLWLAPYGGGNAYLDNYDDGHSKDFTLDMLYNNGSSMKKSFLEYYFGAVYDKQDQYDESTWTLTTSPGNTLIREYTDAVTYKTKLKPTAVLSKNIISDGTVVNTTTPNMFMFDNLNEHMRIHIKNQYFQKPFKIYTLCFANVTKKSDGTETEKILKYESRNYYHDVIIGTPYDSYAIDSVDNRKDTFIQVPKNANRMYIKSQEDYVPEVYVYTIAPLDPTKHITSGENPASCIDSVEVLINEYMYKTDRSSEFRFNNTRSCVFDLCKLQLAAASKRELQEIWDRQIGNPLIVYEGGTSSPREVTLNLHSLVYQSISNSYYRLYAKGGSGSSTTKRIYKTTETVNDIHTNEPKNVTKYLCASKYKYESVVFEENENWYDGYYTNKDGKIYTSSNSNAVFIIDVTDCSYVVFRGINYTKNLLTDNITGYGFSTNYTPKQINVEDQSSVLCDIAYDFDIGTNSSSTTAKTYWVKVPSGAKTFVCTIRKSSPSVLSFADFVNTFKRIKLMRNNSGSTIINCIYDHNSKEIYREVGVDGVSSIVEISQSTGTGSSKYTLQVFYENETTEIFDYYGYSTSYDNIILPMAQKNYSDGKWYAVCIRHGEALPEYVGNKNRSDKNSTLTLMKNLVEYYRNEDGYRDKEGSFDPYLIDWDKYCIYEGQPDASLSFFDIDWGKTPYKVTAWDNQEEDDSLDIQYHYYVKDGSEYISISNEDAQDVQYTWDENNTFYLYADGIESNLNYFRIQGKYVTTWNYISGKKNTYNYAYGKDINAVIMPASTTKTMTAIVALEHLKLTDYIDKTYADITAGSNTPGLEVNDYMTLNHALYLLLSYSDNTIACSICRNAGYRILEERYGNNVGIFGQLYLNRQGNVEEPEEPEEPEVNYDDEGNIIDDEDSWEDIGEEI